jgi:hypothetical protein
VDQRKANAKLHVHVTGDVVAIIETFAAVVPQPVAIFLGNTLALGLLLQRRVWGVLCGLRGWWWRGPKGRRHRRKRQVLRLIVMDGQSDRQGGDGGQQVLFHGRVVPSVRT